MQPTQPTIRLAPPDRKKPEQLTANDLEELGVCPGNPGTARMGLARQDRGAAACAGVCSPATSLQQRACPQPPCAQRVPGGAGPSAALTLLGDDPYHQSSRRLAADPAAPGMRPRDYRDRLLGPARPGAPSTERSGQARPRRGG